MDDPADFVDAEIIKDKLEELKELIEALTDRFEGLQESLDELKTEK